MYKITAQVEGMACGMCEAHVNEAVRKHFRVKKVTSSHSKGITEILTEMPMTETELRTAIGTAGYRVESVTVQPYEKKGLFSFLHK